MTTGHPIESVDGVSLVVVGDGAEGADVKSMPVSANGLHSLEPAVLLEGYDPKTHLSIDVSGCQDPDEMHFVVSTPCYLPPGAKQQQF